MSPLNQLLDKAVAEYEARRGHPPAKLLVTRDAALAICAEGPADEVENRLSLLLSEDGDPNVTLPLVYWSPEFNALRVCEVTGPTWLALV